MMLLKQAFFQKFTELESSSADPEVVRHISELIRNGSDFDLYKINVYRLSTLWNASADEVLRAFLFATQLGIFDLNWDIHCPSCNGIPSYHRHLMELSNTAHCAFCQVDWALDFADQVEVTFTINPEIRAIQYADFTERDFNGAMQWFVEVRGRENRYWNIAECIEPEKTGEYQSEFLPGEYVYWVPCHLEKAGKLIVSGETAEEVQEVILTVNRDGSFSTSLLELRPGVISVRLTSNYPQINGFLIGKSGLPDQWVSANYVTNQQVFRNLFSGEFLSPDTRFALKSVCLLFTDIKSSTEMYEREGDSTAYNLVKNHFSIMEDIISQWHGGIVKTIGDAVMASFPDSLDAIRAACMIQEYFSGPDSPVKVKLGLHRGPVITVTSNRNLDYFGRTVNLAARIQGESREDQLVLSESMMTPDAFRLIEQSGYVAVEDQALLKGIEGDCRIYRINFNEN